MAIIGIVAVARNLAIGKGGQLPWRYSSDLRHFKEKTTGSAVVMGHKTWCSIGKPLPNRDNIVVSRSKKIDAFPEVKVVATVDQAIAAANHTNDVYIIGGAEIYRLFADRIDMWIVTEVPVEVADADAFMPSDFLNGFHLLEVSALEDGLKVKTYARSL